MKVVNVIIILLKILIILIDRDMSGRHQIQRVQAIRNLCGAISTASGGREINLMVIIIPRRRAIHQAHILLDTQQLPQFIHINIAQLSLRQKHVQISGHISITHQI